MNDIWIAFSSALFGALIGTAGSILVVVIQNRSENRRERRRLAIQAAVEDYKVAYDLLKERGKGSLQPLAGYIHYHSKIIELLDTDRLTPIGLWEISPDLHQFNDALDAIDQQIRKSQQLRRTTDQP